ncbi:MAG: dihydropteroate synthase [Victivallaceae bacterium]|nr:dihydropteroate synthase [Victivallaceae bacterium]
MPNNFARILGIINATPDSFSGGAERTACIKNAVAMLDAGVDAIDVGGESTRPGAAEVPAANELIRVIPVIEGILAQRPGALISVDTRKAAVARAAVRAGAAIINDVSMLGFDPAMAETAAETGAGLVIAHTRGIPEEMNANAVYSDVVREVLAELMAAVKKAVAAGVDRSKIIIDPNLGFAKNTAQNLEILRNIERFRATGFPVMIGHSRKRFIGEICAITDAAKRDGATLGLSVALARRVDWLRVHDGIGHAATFKLLALTEKGAE